MLHANSNNGLVAHYAIVTEKTVNSGMGLMEQTMIIDELEKHAYNLFIPLCCGLYSTSVFLDMFEYRIMDNE